jgi:MSHA biogenesis protein MshJ
VNAFEQIAVRARPLIERVDQMSLRERVTIFGAGVALLYVAWQTLLMDPLTARAHAAEQRLAEVRHRLDVADLASTVASQDPAISAALRNRALDQRLAAIDAELAEAARGYVSPGRVAELLRELLASQQGLKLLSLRNLPVESLGRPPPPAVSAALAEPATAATVPDASDRGPFLHPVELIVEGDYLSVVSYLQALEHLPWRMHWERLELRAGDYPLNRVRIDIGALSLSRDWMSVGSARG